jgi:hypothetical protein
MQPNEAADVVKAIADSIQANPGQFNLAVTVNVTGFNASNTGGVGFQANNSGGIGFNSGIGNTQIQFGQQEANKAFEEERTALITRLKALEAQLREAAPDEPKVKSLADAVFASKWVPAVITSTVAALLKAILGYSAS